MAYIGETQVKFDSGVPSGWIDEFTTISGNQLLMQPTSVDSAYFQPPTTDYDFRNSHTSIEVVNAGGYNSLSNYQFDVGVWTYNASLAFVYVAMQIDYPGVLRCSYYNESGAFINTTSTVYNSTNHRFLRIVHNSTNVLWQYSANGRTWTTMQTTALSTWPTTTWSQCGFALQALDVTGGTTITVDNYNHYYHDAVVQEASHAHSVDAVVVTHEHTIAPAEAAHTHLVDGTVLTQKHTLTIPDASQGHTSDNITVSQTVIAEELCANVITMEFVSPRAHAQDALHGQTADNIDLTQKQTLVVNDTSHDHTAEVALITNVGVTTADSMMTIVSDEVVLTQWHNLAVDDTTHYQLVGVVHLLMSFSEDEGAGAGRYGREQVTDGIYEEVSIPVGSFPEG